MCVYTLYMYIHIYIYVYIYVYIYIHMYTYMHMHIQNIHTYVYKCIYIDILIYIFKCFLYKIHQRVDFWKFIMIRCRRSKLICLDSLSLYIYVYACIFSKNSLPLILLNIPHEITPELAWKIPVSQCRGSSASCLDCIFICMLVYSQKSVCYWRFHIRWPQSWLLGFSTHAMEAGQVVWAMYMFICVYMNILKNLLPTECAIWNDCRADFWEFLPVSRCHGSRASCLDRVLMGLCIWAWKAMVCVAHCVAVCCSVLQGAYGFVHIGMKGDSMCCSLLKFVAGCCRLLQRAGCLAGCIWVCAY